MAGSTTTWYCLGSPPQAFTSVTPGTARNRGAISQSRIVRRSIAETPSPSTVNWKTSPRPVVTGPISGLPSPGGMASRACDSRSFTSWRAK